MQLPQRLSDLIATAPDLSEDDIEQWLNAPAGKCVGCDERMARWEQLNRACRICHPPPLTSGCSCSLNRSRESGHSGWHFYDDGAHGVAWERCPLYQRATERDDPLQ